MIRGKRFISIRKKVFLASLIAGLLILCTSVLVLWRACYNLSAYAVFTKVSDCLASFSNNTIFVDYDEFSVTVTDNRVFDFELWQNRPETQRFLENADFEVLGYTYSEAEEAFVLAEGFEGGRGALERLDGSVMDYSGKASIRDILLKGKHCGWYSIPGGIHRFSHSWIYISQQNRADGEPIRAIGVGIDMFEMNETCYRVIYAMIGLMILLLTLTILFVTGILTKQVKNLSKVSDYLKRIDGGTLPDEPLTVESSDEIAQTAATVNQMVEGLREHRRIELDLDVAKRLQTTMLPTQFPPFPNHHEFELYATMHAAKVIGGDFYDFFMPDEKHLAFVIADVSGKGIPAALFMAEGRTLIRGAVSLIPALSDAVAMANDNLCEDNKQDYFITVWAGILNLETGSLDFVNAGHNPPLLRRNGGTFAYLTDMHGLPMGCMNGIKYRQGRLQLNPGDRIYLYTDGVTEANDVNNNLYGADRLSEYVNAHRDVSPKEMLEGVKADMDAFTGDAPQFDDITMLMLRYDGNSSQNV